MAKSWAPWFGERYSRKPKPPKMLGYAFGRPVYSQWAMSMLERAHLMIPPMTTEQINRILDAEEAKYGRA